MEIKKIMWDYNNDQVSRTMDFALNPVIISEVNSRSRADEDTGVDPSYQLHVQNQLRSSSNSGFNQAPSYQCQPNFCSLNQPGSSSDRATNRAKFHQLQPQCGYVNQLGSSSNYATNNGALLHQLQPQSGYLNQPRSSSNDAINRAQLDQWQPHPGYLNQPRLSQPNFGSLNQQGSSSNYAANQALSYQSQPQFGSLNQPGYRLQQPFDYQNLPAESSSSSNYGFNQAPSHQLQPRYDSLNQPRSSSNSLIEKAIVYKLMQHYDSLNQSTGSNSQDQLGFVSTGSAPQWNVLSRSDLEQQNHLPPQTTREPHTQLIKSQPSSLKNVDLRKYWDKMLIPIVNGVKALVQREKAGAGEVLTVTDIESGEIQGGKENADTS